MSGNIVIPQQGRADAATPKSQYTVFGGLSSVLH